MAESSVDHMSPEAIARFWDRVKVGEPNECWEWQGAQLPKGYGHMRIRVARYQYKDTYSHRVAYELTHGPCPDEALVLHSCDNPPCCNPAHLRPGTHQDNADDRGIRGRTHSGPNPKIGAALQGKAKPDKCRAFTAETVRAIRAQYATGQTSVQSLADTYGVNSKSIWQLLHRHTYAEVE